MIKIKYKTMPDSDSPSSPQRDAILRAAAQLFRTNGYDRTTVRELADAVGLQSGSLFHHFKSKDEILFGVMEQALELTRTAVIEAESRSKTPREKVANVLRAYLTALLAEEHRDYMTVLLYDFRSLSPDMARRVQLFRRQLAERVESALQEAAPEGESRAAIHLKSQYIFGAMNWAVQWYKPQGAKSLQQLAEEFTELSLTTAGLAEPAEQ